MFGLVLWYNPKACVGMIWCEDQGPLAFLGPEVALPDGAVSLKAGDRLFFSIETRDGVRFVRDLFSVTPGQPGVDPREILTQHHRRSEAASRLRIVA